MRTLSVMKFGGAALATPDNILKVCEIIKEYSNKNRLVVVVSAIKGVTDELYGIAETIKKNRVDEALRDIDKLFVKHLSFLSKIDHSVYEAAAKQEIKLLIDLLGLFVKKINKKNVASSQVDFIVSLGERLSARLVSFYLKRVGMESLVIDTRDFLTTTKDFGQAKPIASKSKKKIEVIIFQCLKFRAIPVITGYIGRTEDDCVTTLGRGGSDYTASLIASYIKADKIILWKDVAGLYDKNPKEFPDAQILHQTTYREAVELSRKGAKILHPESILPAKKNSIPIFIKCFLNPDSPGTKIGV